MKKSLAFFLTLFASFNVSAFTNFIANPYTPYPPGCTTILDLQTRLYGDNVVKFFEKEIEIYNGYGPPQYLKYDLSAYRVACADPGRSVIVVAFGIPAGADSSLYWIPQFFPYNLVPGPNSWNLGTEIGDNVAYINDRPSAFVGVDGRSWFFVLDNPTPFSYWGSNPNTFTTVSRYNKGFTLSLRVGPNGDEFVYLPVPSTASLFATTPRIPLSGRLSGNWVVDGAADQGFVISISEMAGNENPKPEELLDSPLLMFLSWYTYDSNGDMLWLTGAAQFEMGATTVAIPIEDVSNGVFMGSKTADRKVVGSVTITGNNCNHLTFNYVLNDLGLGSGTTHLQRLFSLETAGYVCRDLEARIAAK